MNISRGVLVTITVGVIAVSVVGAVSARGMSGGFDHHESLITKIAQKFGLKETEVRGVFDSQRADHLAQMQVKMDERLSQLVKDGKITEAQKKLIEAKHVEIKKNMDSLRESQKNKTPAERKLLMDTKKAELEKWAKDNSIDLQYVMPMGGPRHGMMRRNAQQ